MARITLAVTIVAAREAPPLSPEDSMTQRSLTTLVVGALCVAVGCTSPEPLSPLTVGSAVFQEAPADGNGNKNVLVIDEELVDFTTCASGARLDLRIVGWIQTRFVSQVPQAIQPANFEFIYSNAADETYVWHQVATQRFYLDDAGNLVMQVAGRLGYDGNIGRLVINLTTGEVLSVTGREVFAEDLACAALS
jgi:hypothetical protein